ncbi:MAG TPA: DnaJ C-terminal domain-containing protein, partial [Dehalococcoidia bacterium]|nr:DnaJ C-terminal domain-containing protein [Dehalococcoidia bacterium]
PLVTAVLGGEVKFATLKGAIALKVPTETQNGQTIRLAGLGMPKLGTPTVRGDLYARVKVVLPTKLSPEQKQLFEALQAAL